MNIKDRISKLLQTQIINITYFQKDNKPPQPAANVLEKTWMWKL